ncbi:PKD domain-containing protein [Cellulomonas sp. ATA003]|uniref:PKD domain-containing protein n=1 Tax=Cellulomonas sp. ATA003 TaxID=3073064 RepID=UPI002873ED49|nr:PKD domain-containing protein [Cellulomonas sp. ATA003]WNB85078.1 PKD domain-containing protein [Cellulomonas sp. ATA003]
MSTGVGRQRIGKAGQTGWAHLNGYSSTDTDLTLDVALDKKATGGGTYVSVLGRRVGSAGDYRARLKVQPSGSVTLIAGRGETALKAVTLPGVTYAAGTELSIRLQVTGTSPTTVRAKAWKRGTTEPSAWQVSATDSTPNLQKPGGIATSTYVSGSASNAPVTASFARVAARPAVQNAAPAPSVAITVADLTAAVDGSASVDVDGSIASHAWSFGDGATASGPTATHTYTSAGTYTVTLAVTDNAGARSTKTSSVTVTKPNEAPVARLSSKTDGLVAVLDGSTSTDADGRVVSHAWSFGDGTTGSGPTANHTYSTAGSYTVKLTVYDDKGAQKSTSSTVTVRAPEPVVSLPGAVKPGPANTGVPAGTP